MSDWYKRNAGLIWSWTALIAGAAIVFAATRGTQFQQLGVGLLTAAIALLVAVAVFEAIWHAVVRGFDVSDNKQAAKSAPKHRQRGQ